MNENELQDALKTLLRDIALMNEDEAGDANIPDDLVNLRRVSTFEEDGMLTNNAGLTITTADGSAFQLILVKSR